MPRYRSLATFALVALTAAATAEQAPPPAKDSQGDPLPSGAVARLGTVPRWRHEAAVGFAAFLPDGKAVVTVGQDGVIHLWEFPSGKAIRRVAVDPRGSLSLTPTAALSQDGKTIATSFRPQTVNDWLDREQPFKNAGAKFGKKGVAAAAKKGAEEIRLYDLGTGKELACLKAESGQVVELTFSPNGRQLTSRDSGGTVRVWDWAAGKELQRVAGTNTTAARGDAVAYSPDGNTLLIYGNALRPRFVDVASGKELNPAGDARPLVSVWYTPDGKHVLTRADDDTVFKWDATGKPVGPVRPRAEGDTQMLVSPNGRVGVEWSAPVERAKKGKAAKGDAGPDAVVFDLASGKVLCKLPGAPARLYPAWLLFSPDSKSLAMRPFDGQSHLDLYDVATGNLRHKLSLPKEATGSSGTVANAPTPTMLFSADGKMLAYRKNVSATSVVIFDVASGKELGAVQTGREQADEVDPAELKGFAGKLGAAARRSPLYGAFSPDGRCLAVVGGHVVTVYELASGQPRQTFARKPHGADASASGVHCGPLIAFSPDGKLLARVCSDGAVELVDVLTGRELAAFGGHAGRASAVAFAPDGKALASAGSDGTVLVWDVAAVKRPAANATALTAAELDRCWQQLVNDNPAAAFAAIRDLVAAPREAVAFLKDKVKPDAGINVKRIEQLIFDLDDKQFKVRYRATGELLGIGEAILPALDQALAAGPPPEMKKRLEDLRGRVTGGLLLQGERLRGARAVEALERIGTPEARQVLQALAEGSPGAMLTTSAAAALRRLSPSAPGRQ